MDILMQKKKYRIVTYMMLFIICFLMVPCSAETFYVDGENKDDSGDGSKMNPFHSIQEALDAASFYDIIHVESGIYEERLRIEKPVTIIGSSPQLPVIKGNLNEEGATITFSTDNISMNNVMISNGSIGIYIENATDTILSNLTFFSNQIGLYLTNSSEENLFFYNNFVNNTMNVRSFTDNRWNTSTIGNYWDNYNGNDMNNDGIGDQLYQVSDANNKDYLPSMKPFTFVPELDFIFNPTQPYTTDLIYFTSQATDLDGSIMSWQWDFGDNTSSDQQNPVHRFLKNETYTITLSVTDNLGAINTTSKNITVFNVPPVADFSFTPAHPTDIEEVMFKDLSSDSDGSIVNWTWFFEDNSTSYEQHPVYTFSDNGSFSVMLTVQDDSGATDSKNQSVSVSNVAPIVDFSFTFDNVTPLINEPIYFHDTSVDLDGNIVFREWDFGDGTNASSKHPSHIYKSKGSYTISLTIRDNDGKMKTKSKLITVSDTIHHEEVITEFSLFDVIFVVFLFIMVILVIVLSKKYG